MRYQENRKKKLTTVKKASRNDKGMHFPPLEAIDVFTKKLLDPSLVYKFAEPIRCICAFYFVHFQLAMKGTLCVYL